MTNNISNYILILWGCRYCPHKHCEKWGVDFAVTGGRIVTRDYL